MLTRVYGYLAIPFPWFGLPMTVSEPPHVTDTTFSITGSSSQQVSVKEYSLDAEKGLKFSMEKT